MANKILITGGAGFVGSHVCDMLLASGYDVRLLDNLTPQVHGDSSGAPPAYLSREAELIVGDVRDVDAVKQALNGVSAVIHLAAAVGVGQSMYQIADYVDINAGGTATLLQLLSENPVQKLVVASSMSIYGEGRYRRPDGTIADDVNRTSEQLRQNRWEPETPDGTLLDPIATPEAKAPVLSSVYALTKYAQERMCRMVGEAYGISTVALRFFNIYGPRQALSNPYTGVLAIFGSRLLNGRPPIIFEDGGQLRDFIHVRDIARACQFALESSPEHDGTYNIGSGSAITVRDVAHRLAATLGRHDIRPQISGRYRIGDIRHCFGDTHQARDHLGFMPQVSFEQGIAELAEWLEGKVAVDRVEHANDELLRRGLVA